MGVSRSRALTGSVAAVMVLLALVASVLFAPPSGGQAAGLADRTPDGFSFGGVLHAYDPAWDQGVYSQVASREFNAITATAYMPWGPLNADRSIDTGPLDDVVAWGQQREMLVHGHVLLYPLANQSLAWYQDDSFDGQREELARRYVETMAGSNPGGIDVWDVVNEVIADPYQLENDINVDEWGLRTDFVEYAEIGDADQDYVEKAFEWAEAVVEDDVQLIINDYGAETMNPKSDALFAYVNELKRRGVPIDGVGFQMHLSSVDLDVEELDRTISSMEDNFERFADAGFELYITELDVQSAATTNPGVAPTVDQLRDQATMYQAVTELALQIPELNTMLLWDFADNRSWLNPTDRPLGDLPIGSFTYPAPWSGGAVGESMVAKPAYSAIGQAFDAAPNPATDATGDDTVVRLANAWESTSGFLTRDGISNGAGYDPSNQASLYVLDSTSDDWSSMWWSVEDAGNGYVRIRNLWSANDGYLGRSGEWDGRQWQPTAGIFLGEFDPDGWHQQWLVEDAGDGNIALVNRWDPSTGVLTRDGASTNGGATYTPTPTVSLYAPADWSSQHWNLE